ncbi:MAG: hypothetical protein MRJ93_12945 [Nitrososphaeraceae archaeon]|nr:hypothetical protein [Nitrososphaeraceae archaeon]
MTRKSYNNFGNRVRLNPIAPRHDNTNNSITIKNPELIQEFEQKQHCNIKTIQISIESYKALQSMTEYFNMPLYDDIIQTMVKHFRENVYRQYGKYYDTTD